jgi:hypothetical protein
MLVDQNNLIHNITDAICKMDLEALLKILPTYSIYFDMNKDNLILKFKQLFKDVSDSGNTCFNAHSGICASTECCNKNCCGFAFISDVTQEYFSIVLEIKDGKLEGWSQCFDFSPGNYTLDESKNITIDVWHEERHDFEADDDFLQTITDVKQAKFLLQELSYGGITKSSLLKWLDLYEELFKDSYYFYHHRCRFYKSFDEFGDLFYILVELGTLLKNEDKIVYIIEQMKYTKRKRHLKLYNENENLLQKLNSISIDIYRKNGIVSLTSEGYTYNFDDQDFKVLFDYIELSQNLIFKYYSSKQS